MKPQRYEYCIVSLDKKALRFSRERVLNEYGALGWQLVSVVVENGEIVVYFERPVMDKGER